MKTYIRQTYFKHQDIKQKEPPHTNHIHKKYFKHQDIKQKEPPQKYRLGTISNTKLLAGLIDQEAHKDRLLSMVDLIHRTNKSFCDQSIMQTARRDSCLSAGCLFV